MIRILTIFFVINFRIIKALLTDTFYFTLKYNLYHLYKHMYIFGLI